MIYSNNSYRSCNPIALDAHRMTSFSDGFETVSVVTESLLFHCPAGAFWAACFLTCVLLSCLIYCVWTAETVVIAVWDTLPHTHR